MPVSRVRPENENLRGRLYNWKFESAKRYLNGETDSVKRIVRSLSVLYGNCGWFEGKMGMRVGAVVDSLLKIEGKEG
jgi:hypothetical protein